MDGAMLAGTASGRRIDPPEEGLSMHGRDHVPTRHIITTAVIVGAIALATLPGVAGAATEDVSGLPRCAGLKDGSEGDPATPRWQALLDEDGVVTGYQLTLLRDGQEQRLRTGRRGFRVRVGAGRLLLGERDDAGTRLDMIHLGQACRLWTRQLARHLYPERDATTGTLRLTVHDPQSRRYEGTHLLDPDSGDTEATVEEPCVEICLPNDGGIDVAALEPAGAARPTPEFSAGGWPQAKKLTFRWKPGATPPSWARSPLEKAAEDATSTSSARSPRFVHSTSGANDVAYTGSLPGFCSSAAIACASRSMPTFWGVWIRPHGTDYSWGTLRWCQKISSASGCFDLRRVMLHELGHIAGLNHPSSAGFTLSAGDTVMQGVTPIRPQAGASRHAFGRCDVATLQELYDTPDNKTGISTCNDVATKVTLVASRSSIGPGASVTLTATLKIVNQSVYGQLAANPLNGRSLKLKYRRAGSTEAWNTVWMRSLYQQGRYEAQLTPSADWELKAVFSRPGDEGLRYSRSGIRKVKVTN